MIGILRNAEFSTCFTSIPEAATRDLNRGILEGGALNGLNDDNGEDPEDVNGLVFTSNLDEEEVSEDFNSTAPTGGWGSPSPEKPDGSVPQ